jgi:hypothetical protein
MTRTPSQSGELDRDPQGLAESARHWVVADVLDIDAARRHLHQHLIAVGADFLARRRDPLGLLAYDPLGGERRAGHDHVDMQRRDRDVQLLLGQPHGVEGVVDEGRIQFPVLLDELLERRRCWHQDSPCTMHALVRSAALPVCLGCGSIEWWSRRAGRALATRPWREAQRYAPRPPVARHAWRRYFPLSRASSSFARVSSTPMSLFGRP